MERIPSSSHGIFFSPRATTLSPTNELDGLQSANQLKAQTMLISPSDSTGSEMGDCPQVSGMEENRSISTQGSVDSSSHLDYLLMMAQTSASKRRALEYYSKALRIVNKTASDTDRLIMADILFEIGGIHLALDDPFRALTTFDLCQSIRRQLLQFDDERNATVLQQQVRIYNIIGDPESCIHSLSELIGILSSGKDVQLLREVWLELSRQFDKLSMHAEADSSRDEANRL